MWNNTPFLRPSVGGITKAVFKNYRTLYVIPWCPFWSPFTTRGSIRGWVFYIPPSQGSVRTAALVAKGSAEYIYIPKQADRGFQNDQSEKQDLKCLLCIVSVAQLSGWRIYRSIVLVSGDYGTLHNRDYGVSDMCSGDYCTHSN
jgi:hypothetical protein